MLGEARIAQGLRGANEWLTSERHGVVATARNLDHELNVVCKRRSTTSANATSDWGIQNRVAYRSAETG